MRKWKGGQKKRYTVAAGRVGTGRGEENEGQGAEGRTQASVGNMGGRESRKWQRIGE